MFKLKSHTPFDCSWTSDRKRDWVGNEVADLAAKPALQAWRAHAEFADQYCGWVKFASEVAKSVARSQVVLFAESSSGNQPCAESEVDDCAKAASSCCPAAKGCPCRASQHSCVVGG